MLVEVTERIGMIANQLLSWMILRNILVDHLPPKLQRNMKAKQALARRQLLLAMEVKLVRALNRVAVVAVV